MNLSDELIVPPPKRKIWCYSEWQPMFEEIEGVEFIKGLQAEDISNEKLGNDTSLLVIDDLADEIDSKLLGALYSKLSHHRGISVILLLQVMPFIQSIHNFTKYFFLEPLLSIPAVFERFEY